MKKQTLIKILEAEHDRLIRDWQLEENPHLSRVIVLQAHSVTRMLEDLKDA